MSLFGLYKNAHAIRRARPSMTRCPATCAAAPAIVPILAAAERMYGIDAASAGATGWRGPGVAADGSRQASVDEERLAAQLGAITATTASTMRPPGANGSRRATLDALAEVCAAHPSARIVAGATDVGLWVTKQHRDLGDVVYVGDCDALKAIA